MLQGLVRYQYRTITGVVPAGKPRRKATRAAFGDDWETTRLRNGLSLPVVPSRPL